MRCYILNLFEHAHTFGQRSIPKMKWNAEENSVMRFYCFQYQVLLRLIMVNENSDFVINYIRYRDFRLLHLVHPPFSFNV